MGGGFGPLIPSPCPERMWGVRDGGVVEKPRSRLSHFHLVGLPRAEGGGARGRRRLWRGCHLPSSPSLSWGARGWGEVASSLNSMLISVSTQFNTVVVLNIFINFPCEKSSLMLLPILPNYNFNECLLLCQCGNHNLCNHWACF